MTERFEPTDRTRLTRKPQRGSYDKAVIFGILDGGLMAHLAYVVDGQPFCTPTTYWRDGDRLYWHGSAAGRMTRAQAAGIPVCFTVSHLDGLVLGRSGLTHSALYRSVMAFGHAAPVTSAAAKRRAMDAFIGGLYPGRSGEVRPAHDAELSAITVLGMTIEEASAKIRDGGVNELEADLSADCWAGVVPLAVTLGPVQSDPRLAPGVPVSPSLARYVGGGRLEEALFSNRKQNRGRVDLS